MHNEQLLDQRFQEAFRQISHPRFLNKEAIGGEVPFYIFTYPAEGENQARRNTEGLVKQMREAGHGVCIIDLLELSVEVIRESVDLQNLYELEAEEGPEDLLETLHSLLDMEERFIPALAAKMHAAEAEGNFKVLFIVGVGRVFPFLRSHTLLNNLQREAKDKPTILFFPGKYTGTSLELFGLLKDDNYYRAFQLDSLNLAT